MTALTTSSQDSTRTLYPGNYGMPQVHELLRDDLGLPSGFGSVVAIERLTKAELDELDAELDELDAEYNDDLTRMRTAIDDARCDIVEDAA